MAFKRRQYLVSRIQYRLIALNLGYLALFGLALFFVAWTPLIAGIQDMSRSVDERHQLATQILFLHERVVPVILITAFAFTLHTVLVSHRVLGPLVAFRRFYGALGRGKFDQAFGIRTKDYLHAELEALEAMRKELGSRLRQTESATFDVVAEWQLMRERLEASAAVPREELEQLDAAFDRALEGWKSFELGSGRSERIEDRHSSVPAPLPSSVSQGVSGDRQSARGKDAR